MADEKKRDTQIGKGINIKGGGREKKGNGGVAS